MKQPVTQPIYICEEMGSYIIRNQAGQMIGQVTGIAHEEGEEDDGNTTQLILHLYGSSALAEITKKTDSSAKKIGSPAANKLIASGPDDDMVYTTKGSILSHMYEGPAVDLEEWKKQWDHGADFQALKALWDAPIDLQLAPSGQLTESMLADAIKLMGKHSHIGVATGSSPWAGDFQSLFAPDSGYLKPEAEIDGDPWLLVD